MRARKTPPHNARSRPGRRATEELILWLEATAAAGRPVPAPFLQVAGRLVYEQLRLALPPDQDDVFTLAGRLKAENHGLCVCQLDLAHFDTLIWPTP